MPARIVDAKRVAEHLGYADDSSAMHDWLKNTLGVKPVPGRRGMYDLKAIDAALDRLSKLSSRGSAHDPYEDWKHGDAA